MAVKKNAPTVEIEDDEDAVDVSSQWSDDEISEAFDKAYAVLEEDIIPAAQAFEEDNDMPPGLMLHAMMTHAVRLLIGEHGWMVEDIMGSVEDNAREQFAYRETGSSIH